MAKSDVFELDMLKHIFQNLAITLIGDAAGLLASAAPGSFYIGLHSADPGEAGNQTTNELAYTGYARKIVTRGVTYWTCSGTAPAQAVNAALVTFDACTAGSGTATHFSVGTALSGSGGKMLYTGGLTNPTSLAISAGIVPEFAIGALVVTED